MFVYERRRNVLDIPCKGDLLDLFRDALTLLRGYLLRIVEPFDPRIVGQYYSGHRQRTGNRAAAHLIEARNQAGFAKLALERVHALKACALGVLRIKTPKLRGEGLLDPFALIGRQGSGHGLVRFAVGPVQGLFYLCQCAHCGYALS